MTPKAYTTDTGTCVGENGVLSDTLLVSSPTEVDLAACKKLCDDKTSCKAYEFLNSMCKTVDVKDGTAADKNLDVVAGSKAVEGNCYIVQQPEV